MHHANICSTKHSISYPLYVVYKQDAGGGVGSDICLESVYGKRKGGKRQKKSFTKTKMFTQENLQI